MDDGILNAEEVRNVESRRRGLSVGEKLTLLFVGGGIGAVVALLLTPKSGEDLREDIADITRKGVERGREAAHDITERAGEYYEAAKERAGEFADATRDRATDFYHIAEEKARQLAEQAREAAESPRGTLAAAIEAGKRAYYEEKRRTEASSILTGRASYPYELGDGADKTTS